MRKLKVEARADVTQIQHAELQRLGCEAVPFITWPHALIFAADCTDAQEQALRQLRYVTRVEPMPTYGPAQA